ncbi:MULTISPECIES: hypothetical protein [unclassified Microbacterium]|uniref:hypothetical protein n=1 Tax=unclassified Microbacterium TaxID=2609290 RepID=UPI002035A6EE|nr:MULTISPECIES: hypothetical protein [unclassified Microbacterium]
MTSLVRLIRADSRADAPYAHAVPSTLLGVTVRGYDQELVEIKATAVVTGD